MRTTFLTKLGVQAVGRSACRANQFKPRAASLAELRISGIVACTLRAAHRGLCLQLVEQRLRVFQIGGVEAFGEPVVNLGKLLAGLLATTSITQQSGEASRRAELE